jgi:hypothetical protein
VRGLVRSFGGFTFATPVPSGANFGTVTVSQQPTNPPQYCTVTGAAGGPVVGNVNTIAVNCVSLTLGGTILGLTSDGLLLRNGNGPTLPITAVDTMFTFLEPVAASTPFGPVTVADQPTTQNCVVTGGSGSAGITSVASVVVTCTDNFHCLTAAENTTLVLPCPAGQMISAVNFAAYGVDPPIGACGSYTPEANNDDLCGGDAVGDLQIVRGICPVGSSTCRVDVASQEEGDTFPDHCPGVGKALTLQITCVPM